MGSDRLPSGSELQQLLSKARTNPKDLIVVGDCEANIQHEDYGYDALSASRMPFDHNILSLNNRRDKRSLCIGGLCDVRKRRLEAEADSPGEAQTSKRERCV